MSEAAPEPLWDWPHRLPAEVMQRLVDVQAILALERGPRALQHDFQRRALARLLAHLRGASPWWRQRLAGVPAEVDPEDMASLPIMSRADFREFHEAGAPLPLPPSHGTTLQHSTSGTSGIPVRFHLSDLATRLVKHQYEADHERQGRDLHKRRLIINTRVPEHAGQEHIVQPAMPLVGEGEVLLRRTTHSDMAGHARWVSKMSPAYISVVPVIWASLHDEYERGIAPPRGLLQVIPHGESLPPELRERTRAITGASMRDRYSCEEIGPMAFQCPVDETRYHVTQSNAIVEVLDEQGRPCASGVPGRLIVTGLHHWASPMLRYDIGDQAAMEPHCSCGASCPVLSGVVGRRLHMFLLRDGQRVQAFVRAKQWLAAAPILQHRMIQQSVDRVRVELVLAQALSEEQRQAVAAMLSTVISDQLAYEVHQVTEITWPAGAKRQDTVSLVP